MDTIYVDLSLSVAESTFLFESGHPLDGDLILMAAALKERIAERIRYFRALAGMSQATLAEKVDVTTEMISRVERGVTLPGVERLAKIADALSVDVSELLSVQDLKGTKKQTVKDRAIQAVYDQLKSLDKEQIELIGDIAKAVRKRVQ